MKFVFSLCFTVAVGYCAAVYLNTTYHDLLSAEALAGPMLAGQTEAERACVVSDIIREFQMLAPETCGKPLLRSAVAALPDIKALRQP